MSPRKRLAGSADALHHGDGQGVCGEKPLCACMGRLPQREVERPEERWGVAPVHGNCWGKDMHHARQKDSRKASKL